MSGRKSLVKRYIVLRATDAAGAWVVIHELEWAKLSRILAAGAEPEDGLGRGIRAHHGLALCWSRGSGEKIAAALNAAARRSRARRGIYS